MLNAAPVQVSASVSLKLEANGEKEFQIPLVTAPGSVRVRVVNEAEQPIEAYVSLSVCAPIEGGGDPS
jgi:hypothetical protein